MINETKFKKLTDHQADGLCSIYLPTHRVAKMEEDRIRLKNAIKEAKTQIEATGKSEKEAERFLRPASDLLDQEDFFKYLSDGLAIFIGEDYFHHEIVPIDFNPYVSVGDRFYLRPLLPLLNQKDRFFLLALSLNEVRFFEGHQYSITPVKIADLVPRSMGEVFDYADLPEAQQHHSGNGGDNRAVFHGHGYGEDDRKEDIIEFFREVDKGLMEMLHDERSPMLIAGVDYLIPLYNEVNNYKPTITDSHVGGSTDGVDPVLLHEKAWPIMADRLNGSYEKVAEQFHAELANGRASSIITDIVPAAVYGKVDTLFINKDYRAYGTFDKDSNQLEIHSERKPESRDLIEMAAINTYLNGGEVHTLAQGDLPVATANINATYRYA